MLLVPLQDDTTALVVGLAQIRETGFVLDVLVRPEVLRLPQEEDAVVTAPVRFRAALTRIAEQVYVQGVISGEVTVPCSRCLETLRSEFATETRVVFLPPVSDKEEPGRPLDDLDVYEHDGVRLDLRPLVREQVVLSFPVQSLCREDCSGLCQVCGANRNTETCTCRDDGADPRFAVLKQLRFPTSPSE